MANALYLVSLSPSRTGQTLRNKANAVIVVANDVAANANARAAAAAAAGSSAGIWSDATVTALTTGLAAPVLLTTVG